MIDGHECVINTDFRVCLRVIMAFEDAGLTDIEKQTVLLENLYPEKPGNLPEACRIAIKFLNGGELSTENVAGPRVYSFSKDANLIFAAFKQTHNIDLADTEYLHWWKFLALFMDLGSDTAFCNLVSLRRRIKTGVATKEERKTAHELGEIIDVPNIDTRTIREKEQEAEFLRLVETGMRAREVK